MPYMFVTMYCESEPVILCQCPAPHAFTIVLINGVTGEFIEGADFSVSHNGSALEAADQGFSYPEYEFFGSSGNYRLTISNAGYENIDDLEISVGKGSDSCCSLPESRIVEIKWYSEADEIPVGEDYFRITKNEPI